MSDGGAVVPVNAYVVAVMVLLTFLCWSVSAWQRHRDRDRRSDRAYAARHRYLK